MAVYSFRARCQSDVDKLRDQAAIAGHELTVEVWPCTDSADLAVECYTDLNLVGMNVFAGIISDNELIRETLRPCRLEENSLERDTRNRCI